MTLTGRIKELINRGGEKISPIEVRELEIVSSHHYMKPIQNSLICLVSKYSLNVNGLTQSAYQNCHGHVLR